MRIIFTKHSIIRMRERKISRKEILEVIHNPQFTEEIEFGRVKSGRAIGGRAIRVISKRIVKGIIIITCY